MHILITLYLFDQTARPKSVAHCCAIGQGFYPGQSGGDALTAVLFGDVAPVGRLPMTIYPKAYIWKRQLGEMWLRESGPDCVSNCKQGRDHWERHNVPPPVMRSGRSRPNE